MKRNRGPDVLFPREARDLALARRRALPSEHAASLSQQVIDRFLMSPHFGSLRLRGTSVALYKALHGELDLSMLEPVLRAAGAKLLFPRMATRDALEPEFAEVGLDEVCVEGVYKIREPHPRLPAVDPSQIGLIFVPGSAFGACGERVGMGGGHYDRFLARVKDPVRIALAYDFQVFDQIKTEAWDQPVDWIVTEKRELRMARR